MTRGLGLISLLVSLAICGLLYSSQLQGTGSKPSSPQQNRVVQEANSAAAGMTAMQAERELDAYQAEHGTFVGAAVTDISGVTVLHADPTTFCLQISSNGGLLYDAGPGGTPSGTRC
jgi:Tfp pilus assembly protein PilV